MVDFSPGRSDSLSLHFHLDDLDLHCIFDLPVRVNAFSASSSWRFLGGFTSTGFTLGSTRMFATCSLDTVLRFSPTADCRYCVSSTCCVIFGTLTIFSNTRGFCTSMIYSMTRPTYTFHLSVPNQQLRRSASPCDSARLRNFHDFLHDSFRSPLLRNHFDSCLASVVRRQRRSP